jgi:phage baseplate assembly protein W
VNVTTVYNAQLYQGIASPMFFTGNGNQLFQRDHKLIESEIILCLLTGIDEPFMEPGQGVGLETQLFEPGDEVTFVILRNFIKSRLSALEPRIELIDVLFRRITEIGDETKLLVTLVYKIPALVQGRVGQPYSLTVAIGG